ncbi:MAG: hypothetical protein ACE5F1_04195, partial [Planctomycetota bacterium]
MPPDSKFGVVPFHDSVRSWRKKLVSASKANEKKIRSCLDRYRGSGGTMLHDGMAEAMKIKLDKRKEEPYSSSVDEIFLLSDGVPTPGRITDPKQILETISKWNLGAMKDHKAWNVFKREHAAF